MTLTPSIKRRTLADFALLSLALTRSLVRAKTLWRLPR